MSQRIYFRVHGTVQGVNFRYFTQKKATEAGITGWVEGEAQGSPDALKQFLKDIDRGPTHARVVQLDKEDREVKEGEAKFEVRA
ncbi:hypothetical protein JX265_007858 [Neoarthrinium moseri]|uniref:Acylphosphatase-like domain-containing protein n=1 Tax=Neoarthrinium moseri TaxID=1658444 RepID=A0A9Q0ANA6_9PEZI|nr:uncharacterized protein JN550_003439 [Neoarthrinium moseri]KAI1844303.1 hypothetical protein JX266_009594 [Neoarthrinium moseri]KAI1866557.1 hypothetical protein JX265_007858 [Neoarthrinium moseri]KAI1873186.1 hypothetical protein JN550_003439 [Neoarthrinium moseri]